MPILDGSDSSALDAAAARLADGGLVALPTETVYGLGARADDDAAVAAIFAAKGRPADHPLIVHVADASQAPAFAKHWPYRAQRLAQAFWPGPLTVIVPRAPGLATAAAGGQDSIGLRCPAHPVAQALLRAAAALGVPGVAAPSANRFGRVSPPCAAHVAAEFAAELLVLDGGDCDVGIESAIVDCCGPHPSLLRPGALTRAQLEAALGEPLAEPGEQAPRASGTLASHYAPRAKVRLMSAADIAAALPLLAPLATQAAGDTPTAALYLRSAALLHQVAQAPALRGWPCRAMPADAAQAAHELFAGLRALDASGAALIWIETPPTDPAWEGVRDRLQRAAH